MLKVGVTSMNPSDWSLRARQIFGILTPGVVWVFCGLMLLHIPDPPIRLVTTVEPSWVEAAAFLSLSYVVGFALRKTSWSFSVWASRRAAAVLPRVFRDSAMEARADDLRARVADVIKQRYSHVEGFEPPPAERVFGFCKRILRGSSPKLYDHLDAYEDEINLLNLLPLPLFMFALVWIGTWVATGERVLNRYVFPLAAVGIFAAFFCLAQYLRLKSAEHKETFESFLAFHLESDLEPKREF